jgi:hypothetical protein
VGVDGGDVLAIDRLATGCLNQDTRASHLVDFGLGELLASGSVTHTVFGQFNGTPMSCTIYVADMVTGALVGTGSNTVTKTGHDHFDVTATFTSTGNPLHYHMICFLPAATGSKGANTTAIHGIYNGSNQNGLNNGVSGADFYGGNASLLGDPFSIQHGITGAYNSDSNKFIAHQVSAGIGATRVSRFGLPISYDVFGLNNGGSFACYLSINDMNTGAAPPPVGQGTEVVGPFKMTISTLVTTQTDLQYNVFCQMPPANANGVPVLYGVAVHR